MKLNDLFVSNLLESYDDTAIPFSRYDGDSDQTPVKQRDTRKTRLTLRQIHLLRQMRDIQTFEKAREIEKIQKIYKTPEQPVM